MKPLQAGWLTTATLASAVALLAGCHHRQTAVYQPPPPQVQTADDSVAIRSARPTAPVVRSRPQPERPANTAEQPEAHGRPISIQVGVASWYAPPYAGAKAADGTVYDPNGMTAAHRTLPLGAVVRVTNLTNNQSVMVRINDHGPFYGDRIIDLSMAAARAIGVYRTGTAKVQLEAYAPATGYDPAGRWCVQIGAFVDRDDAIQLKNDLLRRYATAKVIDFAGGTGHWVRIDPKTNDRATAEKIAESIHVPDPGAQPYLVRLN